MPARLKHYCGASHLHFMTFSCYHRQPWLASPRRRDLFLRVFEQVRQHYQFVVVGYIVMPEHVHLLISKPENVWSKHKRIEKLRYMHENPVRHGLVLQPEQWTRSSFRHYAYGEAGAVKLNDWIAAVMGVKSDAA